MSHLLALPLACLTAAAATAQVSGLPDVPVGLGSPSARARLRDSAMAHGMPIWRQQHDLNASFSGAWSPASGWSAANPGGADAAAGSAQLRLLPALDLLAVGYGQGAARSWVLRRQAGFGPAASTDTATGMAAQPAPADDAHAALSVDALCLFLLGPLALLHRAAAVHWGPPETLNGQRCDQLLLTVAPGLGLAPESRLALFIDRDIGWLRRLRWASDTSGGGWHRLAEVDFFDHFSLQGMVWPRRFESPSRWWQLGAQAQAGRLTGLDLDRGYGAESLAGGRWTGAAAAPARSLPST